MRHDQLRDGDTSECAIQPPPYGTVAIEDPGDYGHAWCGANAGVPQLNPNVKLTLVFTLLQAMFSSLAFGKGCITLLIFMLTHDNTSVGIFQGVKGLVQLSVSLPGAIAADAFGRQRLLRTSSLIGVSCIIFTVVTLTYRQCTNLSDLTFYYLLLVAASLWAAFVGCYSAPLSALFGDSIASGKRSEPYTWRKSLATLGSALGPGVAAITFFSSGNVWEEQYFVTLLWFGIVGCNVPISMLCCLKDEWTLGAESEGLSVQRREAAPSPGADTNIGHEARWQIRPNVIVTLIASANLISMFGSGLTVRFFSLFLWQDLGMLPGEVNIIYALLPLPVSGSALLAQRLSLTLGRIQVSMLFRTLGVVLLVAISYLKDPVVVVMLYAIRSCVMNSWQGLTRAVLNDYVSKEHRAKWNSIETVSTAVFSASAMLGGYIIDQIGYRSTFLITAALQMVSTLMYAPLVTLVAKERAEAPNTAPLIGFGSEELHPSSAMFRVDEQCASQSLSEGVTRRSPQTGDSGL